MLVVSSSLSGGLFFGFFTTRVIRVRTLTLGGVMKARRNVSSKPSLVVAFFSMKILHDTGRVEVEVDSKSQVLEVPDTEIAEAVTRAIRWNTGIPRDAFTVVVDRGYVTLAGEVPREYQRKAAAIQAARIPGVLAVTNLLTACVFV